MKRLLIAPLIIGLTAPVQARPYGLKPALKVEECISATVQKLHTTWRELEHDPRAIIALSQLREKGYIDSFDLSNKLRKPVLEIRKMLSYAQKEGIIPFDANIK